MKKSALFLILSIPGLIVLSCGNALASGHYTYKSLLESYHWFPGVWNILGWLGSIILITGMLYSVTAWAGLAFMNHTEKQR